MKLELADGHIERPLGMLDKVVVTSCNIEYEHAFAVVDFSLRPNYEIILGRPFMRQFQMIQDWGFNHIYLRQPNATTRINLKDHTFRDVQRTPVKDFASSTVETTVPSGPVYEKPVWICGVDEEGSDAVSEKSSTPYIPEPFPEHKFEPFGWHDVLATLDVCAEKVHATRHCDEEGYDIMSLQMVSVIHEDTETSYTSGSYDEEIILEGPGMDYSRVTFTPLEFAFEEAPCMLIKEEISSFETESIAEESESDDNSDEDMSASEGEEDFYDASDESFDESEFYFTRDGTVDDGRKLKHLIWRDGREFPVSVKTTKTKSEKQRANKRRRKQQVENRKEKEALKPRDFVNIDIWDEPEETPELGNTKEYLMGINAEDCIKDLITGL